MLVSFNNWSIVQFTNKTTSSEDFDAVYKVVLDGISDNMAYIVQLGNAEDPTTLGYYVIKYLYEPYTLQEYQTTYG